MLVAVGCAFGSVAVAVLWVVAGVGVAVLDVSCFPFAVGAPLLDAFGACELAGGAAVVGVLVGPFGDLACEALVWASMVGGLLVCHTGLRLEDA